MHDKSMGCGLCRAGLLTGTIRASLYKKYSMSLEYHLIRDVDELL
jgi:hypothetical protein